MAASSCNTSMLLTGAHAMANHVVDYPGNPGPPVPDADLRGLHARYRIYDALDGWVFLAAPQEHEWLTLASALDSHVELRDDSRFAKRRTAAPMTTRSRLYSLGCFRLSRRTSGSVISLQLVLAVSP